MWTGGPGGGPYTLLRRIAQKVEETGVSVVVEDRPGRGTSPMAVKQAEPDGYTILLGSNATHAANVTLLKNSPYDPVADFQPITLLYVIYQSLIVPTSLGVTSVKELQDLARKKPGGLSYASQGVGSAGHLMAAQLGKAFGAPMVHVPYRSSAAARPDLLTGRVDLIFNTQQLFQGDIDTGTVKALAVASPKRLSMHPTVPTLAEQGIPDIDIESWFGLFAPAKTPADRVEALSKMFTAAAHSVAEPAAKQGFFVRTGSSEEFGALVKNDIVRLGTIIKGLGIEPEQ
jgi:tripartite-type tricarboxylate transporter receptor subunit TctC